MTNPADYLSNWEFFSQAFVPLNNLALPLKPCHRQICDTVEQAVSGDLCYTDDDGQQKPYQYIIFNIAPRIGKTKIGESSGCWMKAYFPDAQIIYTSYGQNLVDRSLAFIGDTMQSPWYQECFGDHLHVRRSNLLTTREGGQIYGAGTGASITGFGAGLKRVAGGYIWIDDPAKPDEALSPVESENIRQWFETTIKSRRNSDRYCPIFICAQRLAPDDLPGYVLNTYPKETLLVKFPALVDGVSQFPETISTETLLNMQATRTGRFVFASQYQQEPISFGGNLIQTDNFARYDIHQPPKWERKIITADTAFTAKTSNDACALQCWGKNNGRAYLIDAVRGHYESPELLSVAKAFYHKHHQDLSPITRLTVEEKASGIGLIQQMRREGLPAEGIERTKDKVTRVHEVLPYIETGMVYVPRDGQVSWLPSFLTECAQFQADGTSLRDDQVDAMVDGVWLTLGKPPSILDVLGKQR